MNKEKVVKGVKIALDIIAGIGIELLCSAMAGSLAGSSRASGFKKACMAVGGIVIGGMVTAQAEKYIDSEVDNLVAKIDEVAAVVNDASEATQETN